MAQVLRKAHPSFYPHNRGQGARERGGVFVLAATRHGNSEGWRRSWQPVELLPNLRTPGRALVLPSLGAPERPTDSAHAGGTVLGD